MRPAPPPLPTKRQRAPDPLIGSLAATRYRIRGLIGEGGMGRVYLAEHEAIQKKVALKVLRNEFSSKPEIVSRFQQEAISASRIKHPNVLDVFDFGQLADGCFFLAMEYLEGVDLADELQKHRQIEARRGVRFALQMCRALGAAHARGVVHRDMKPENVFLQRTDDGDEIVKILDFGIAQLRSAEDSIPPDQRRRRLTRTGMIFGTPEYMAPEQATGKKADSRVDVYAVGVILYEMFTGAVPFSGDTFMSVLQAHAYQPLPNMRQLFPDVAITPPLQQAIERALSKNPDDRFPSMNDMAAALLLTPEGARAGSMRPPGLRGASAPAPAQFPPSARVPQMDGRADKSSPTLVGSAGPDSGARAQTQLGAEALSPGYYRPRRRWAYVFGTVTLLAAAGAAAMALVPGLAPRLPHVTERDQPGPAAATKPATVANATGSPAVPAKAPELPTDSAVAEAVPDAGPAKTGVMLRVTTTPVSAVLLKNGFQVCDSTPCDVSATIDETVTLEARKGALRGTAKVLAQRDQAVAIYLAGKPSARSRGAGNSEKLCEVEVDGLKILRPCN
jgi:serine/threonine-protein kinase